MRTTIDIPEQEHTLYTSLANAQRTSLSKLLLNLARRGLETTQNPASERADKIDPVTGLCVFRSDRPISLNDVKALVDDDDFHTRETL